MRTSKSFPSIQRQYFYPELKRCPFCRQPLQLLRGLYLKKTIQTLNGVLWLGGYAAHCVNLQCAHCDGHYLSTELGALSLPKVTYGLDVIVRVGWRRQHDHRTMSEIGQELRAQQMQITDREVERLWDYYRALLRGLKPSRSGRVARGRENLRWLDLGRGWIATRERSAAVMGGTRSVNEQSSARRVADAGGRTDIQSVLATR